MSVISCHLLHGSLIYVIIWKLQWPSYCLKGQGTLQPFLGRLCWNSVRRRLDLRSGQWSPLLVYQNSQLSACFVTLELCSSSKRMLFTCHVLSNICYLLKFVAPSVCPQLLISTCHFSPTPTFLALTPSTLTTHPFQCFFFFSPFLSPPGFPFCLFWLFNEKRQ